MSKCSDVDYGLGVIGAGVMGGALVEAALQAGVLEPARVIASDISEDRRKVIETLGCAATEDNHRVVRSSEAVLLAVKPQVLRDVLGELREDFAEGQLLISIAAGLSLATLADVVGSTPRLVRVMPNICCTVGAAASAYALGDGVTGAQEQFVREFLSAAGEVVSVPEGLLDAVTGLSGSGPAFVAMFIGALADGGVAAGLPRAEAQRLAAQTALGAARWLLENDAKPAALKDLVCSPGGTTIAGVRALEAGGFRSAVIEAVVAAARRAEELGG
jgi:pyrroline-5-carboxylate reductase